jgi:hypothetical protein
MDMSKERIFVRREDVDLDVIFSNTDLTGMLDGAKQIYARFKQTADKENLMVEFDTQWAGYDGGTDVVANLYRWETDKEYQARIDELKAKEEAKRLKKEAKKAKELAKILADEQAERELFEKLKKKFGV